MHKKSARMSGRIVAWGAAAMLLSSQVFSAAAQDATPVTGAMATPTVLEAGQFTIERPFLIPAEGANITITPLLTAGEKVGDYQMAGVPDGLGAYLGEEGAVVFMNHELSKEGDENLSDSRVSRLVLDPATGAVLSGSYVVTGTEGYWSLCSASLAGPEVGFDPPVFLTGEETAEGPKGGLAMAINAVDGTITELPWLGHFSHENQIAVPGFEGKTVVVATDDDSNGSELYMYIAASPADFLAGKGQLYVFKADNAAGTADIAKGTTLTGSFIPVDQANNTDAKTLQDKVWADGAFRFVRTEDITYDRNSSNILYFTDTGDNEDPNLAGDGAPFTQNGRLYSLTLDPADPTKVTAFTVLLDGDAGDELRNPDNIDADKSTIMIQEDLNSYNRAENSDAVARIWAYSIADGTLTPVALLDQSAGDGLVDAGDKAGSWESSGILNVSEIFGEGTWLTDVQAHSITAPQFGGEDESGQLLIIRPS
ncbi:MAG: DUF839 domain-containing protein [Thermomicrobiales bacterium]